MALEPTAGTEHPRCLGPYALLNTANQATASLPGVQIIVSIHREVFPLILPEPLKVFTNVIQQTLQKGAGTAM